MTKIDSQQAWPLIKDLARGRKLMIKIEPEWRNSSSNLKLLAMLCLDRGLIPRI